MANIFHVERNDNKITLGTTGTTINIASHTASQSLALDASKNLVSVDLSAIYQPLDIVLTDLAALDVVADNEFIVGTGAGEYAHESGDTVRTSLGLAIGTNVQAWDAGLDSLASLTYVSDSFIKVTDEDTYAIRTIAETKTDLDLNLVENTALSTWAGTTNITTLGTIATGVWEGTSISTTYTAAKCTDATADNTAGNETSHATVLVDGDFGSAGLMNTDGAGAYSIKAIGTDVQAFSEVLKDLDEAGIVTGDSYMLVGTDAGTFAWETTTTLRTSIGLGTGDDTQFRTLTTTAQISAGTYILTDLTLYLKEQASANTDAEGYGQVWVKNTTPNQLWFTDDAGTDFQVHSSLSAYTDEDSDTETLVKDHAYLAVTDGWASAVVTTIDAGETISMYVGVTDDPAGAGDLIDKGDAVGTDQTCSVKALVAKGEYFEVTGDDTPIIRWKSFGTLSKPVDQEAP